MPLCSPLALPPLRVRLTSFKCTSFPSCCTLPTRPAGLSHSDYPQLDKPLAHCLRRAHRLLPTTAHDMLFFPASHGGPGHHKLSDLAQTQKWSELQRALRQPGEASWAATGLLERGFRQIELLAAPSNLRQNSLCNLQYLKCFTGSLLEWGAAADCVLISHQQCAHHSLSPT